MWKLSNWKRSLMLLSAVMSVAAFSLAAVRYPAGGTPEEPPGLTIYTGDLALVRRALERPLSPGIQTVRVDELPSNMDRSSLIVLNPGVTLLGSHGFRTYQDPGDGNGVSLNLDLEVSESLETLRIAFLTGGLGWSTDYSVIVARDDGSASVGGYATIKNGAGATFENAGIQLLAGTIQQSGSMGYRDAVLRAMPMESEEAPSLGRQAFADYHIYTVSDPLTLRSGESRRIRLLGAAGARTEKIYTLTQNVVFHQRYQDVQTQPVAVSYRIHRPLDSQLGAEPLPAGQVRVYQEDGEGRVQLLGVSRIGNTPKGQDLRVTTGHAFDITGERTQTDFNRPAANVYETAWRVELRNGSDREVTVQVIEQISNDWSIVESSHPAEKLSATAVRFEVAVPAGGSSTLEYRVSVRT